MTTTPELHPHWVRLTAICALASSLTTLLLWALPKLYAPAGSFAGLLALQANPYHTARLWVNLLHIPLALTAYLGLAYVRRQRALPVVALGLLWLAVWGAVELAGVAVNLFAVKHTWSLAYAGASPARQQVLRAYIEGYQAVWDGLFFVLLLAFLLGSLGYGWATWRGRGLEKALSVLFWLAVPLTLLIILSGYFGQAWAEPVVNGIYPLLQPVSRACLGWFLWRCAREGSGTG